MIFRLEYLLIFSFKTVVKSQILELRSQNVKQEPPVKETTFQKHYSHLQYCFDVFRIAADI